MPNLRKYNNIFVFLITVNQRKVEKKMRFRTSMARGTPAQSEKSQENRLPRKQRGILRIQLRGEVLGMHVRCV